MVKASRSPLFLCLLLLGLCSCSLSLQGGFAGSSKSAPSAPSASGSMGFSRPTPPASDLAPNSLLSFMPSAASKLGTFLVFDARSGRVALMRDGLRVSEAPAEGLSSLAPGVYEVALKQDSASWHAASEYYSRRNLPLPGEGTQDRFLRGALGHHVIYLDDQTPIHSGPLWLREIGGVRIAPEYMQALYEQIQVGTFVQIVR